MAEGIAAGVYRIVPATDPENGALTVYDRYLNNGLLVWTRNDSPEQRWVVATGSGHANLLCAPTGYGARVYNGLAAEGRQVVLYDRHDDWTSLQWDAAADGGSVTVNGTAYPTYTLAAVENGGSPRYLTGGPYATDARIKSPVADKDTGLLALSQRWAFVPAVRKDAALAVPSSIGAEDGSAALWLSEGTVRPSFAYAPGDWEVQCRYRTRTRADGGSKLSEWSDWKELATGSTACLGWGEDPAAMAAPERSGDRYVLQGGVQIDNSGAYDRTEVQFEIRQAVASWDDAGNPYVGAGSCATVVCARPVEITGCTMVKRPDGVQYAWTASNARGAWTARVSSPRMGWTDVYGDGSDSVFISNERHYSVPELGDVEPVTVKLTGPDGLSVEKTFDVTVTGDGGSNLSLAAVVDGATATVTASDASAKAWLVVPRGHGDRYVPLEGNSPWKVLPPLGVPWKVLAGAEGDAQGDGWAVKTQEFPAIVENPHAYHVTTRDGKADMAAAFHTGEHGPEFEPQYSRSRNSVEVEGRERPAATDGTTTTAKWALKGTFFGKTMADDSAAFDAVAHSSHVLFRSPRGFWAQAGVTDADIDLGDAVKHEFSMSFEEELW